MKKVYILFTFAWCFISFGQIKLEGTVTDSLQGPLESASLVAINQKTKDLESYVLTDVNGKYKLNLNKNTKYTKIDFWIGQLYRGRRKQGLKKRLRRMVNM